MKLGFVSDSLGGMSFTDMLDHAARMGVSGVEVNTCGWSTAPHFDLKGMLGNPVAQKMFKQAFTDRGLEIISLNANGNPLHPTDPKQGSDLRDTIRDAYAEKVPLVGICFGQSLSFRTDMTYLVLQNHHFFLHALESKYLNFLFVGFRFGSVTNQSHFSKSSSSNDGQ